jgi:hypothetical protein
MERIPRFMLHEEACWGQKELKFCLRAALAAVNVFVCKTDGATRSALDNKELVSSWIVRRSIDILSRRKAISTDESVRNWCLYSIIPKRFEAISSELRWLCSDNWINRGINGVLITPELQSNHFDCPSSFELQWSFNYGNASSRTLLLIELIESPRSHRSDSSPQSELVNANDLHGTKPFAHRLVAYSECFCFFLHILSPLYANKNENLNCAAADKEQRSTPLRHKPHLVIVRWASSSPQFLHLLQFRFFFFSRRGKTNEQFSISVSAQTQSDYFASA